MIKLEIIHSSDPLAIGTYDYLFDKIFVGKSKKCDLIFDDKEFPACYLTISLINNSLVVENGKNAPSYLVNGKKIKGPLKIKRQDIIQVGVNQIKILDFNSTFVPIDLTPFYEKISSASEEDQAALAILENALIALEDNNNV
jgi:hypothetical protein